MHAGRTGSVQPSPRAGDGFSTPLITSSHKQPAASSNVLDRVQAQALASHVPSNKADGPTGASLTDDLLNL